MQSLNEKRPGLSPFIVNVMEIPPWRFYQLVEEHDVPTFTFGWISDYADPDDFVRPFMYQRSAGISPLNDTVNNLIDLALGLPNGDERNQTYQMLQYMYYQDAWGIPLAQLTHFELFRDWVRGWYYNQLQPELDFYNLYKEMPENPEPVDVSVV
jgi:peptide/nickel transport system substrate-binding protein